MLCSLACLLPARRLGPLSLPALAAALFPLLAAGCGDSIVRQPEPPALESVFALNDGCFVLDAVRPGRRDTRYLVASDDGLRYEFSGRDPEGAVRLRFKASDLGTYLLYDQDRRYVVSEVDELAPATVLDTDLTLLDDTFVSPAEWELETSAHDPERLALRSRRTQRYMSVDGTTDDPEEAGVLTLSPTDGCVAFPELTVDATGEVTRTTFDDGDLYGIVDTHSHLLSNFGFGGGGVVHGAPFHRLGVEAALPDCEMFHGFEGRRDLMGAVFDSGREFNFEMLAVGVLFGRLSTPVHDTRGYPDFTEWPNAHRRSTHQVQYYKWLERAYLGGLRLVVQHAVSNQVLCDISVGSRAQSVRYSCNDMVAVDRQLEEVRVMERYIDAQSGGPGRGWFRVVTDPAQAREVIAAGKLAVILGIETSNLFDCFVTPREGFPTCDAAYVRERLAHYHDLGVRALFPVHKFDNAFSPGDGQRGFMEVANALNSGHYNNFSASCDPTVSGGFDGGNEVVFSALNRPRAEYFSDPPLAVSTLGTAASGTLLPFIPLLEEPPSTDGPYCQSAGLQPLGELLLTEMMLRGMLIEVAHLPNHAMARTFEMLEAADYPAVSTHNNAHSGRIYDIGGLASANVFNRCQAPDRVGAMGDPLRARVQLILDHGGYPGVGFSFDLNGFAGAPGPRFGPDGCGDGQTNPVTYPFASYAGDVTFQQPQVGNRTVDFNTEGFVHVGMLPELIEDARHDGVTDAELEPLYRSAEAYVRVWERAEARAAELAAAQTP